MPLSLSHRFALASAAVFASILSLPVQAQIVPDGTLGTQVFGACGGTGGACGVINGTTRGSNLFHSFQQFSLPNPTDGAGFVIAPAIQNVIVRVSGVGQPFISNINGIIATFAPTGTLTPANFFLL
ncbi:MAG: filamentous hemagglutinin N-terminal domain-containing protein, partial [Leptolyngbyaceae cyanobacterium CAN_BIN12]|nr:filamentous hemagglutinin N-terminal domain-containing protein [Leptolyngbyaceae cyanobacterium CAN_BIN12]